MTDPSAIPEAGRQLLAVYESREVAESARDRVLAAGAPESAVHIDEGLDYIAALRAEMHEELSASFIVPNAVAVYPKESAQGLFLTTVAGAAIGLLAAVPLALLDVGSSYPVRLLVFGAIGIVFGSVIALVAGPALAARRPDEPSAAARGTVLRVEADTAELRSVLASLGPIRLDEVTPAGDPIGSIATEGPDKAPDQMGSAVSDMTDNLRGGDDFHRPPES
jgi:hypothetical protein